LRDLRQPSSACKTSSITFYRIMPVISYEYSTRRFTDVGLHDG